MSIEEIGEAIRRAKEQVKDPQVPGRKTKQRKQTEGPRDGRDGRGAGGSRRQAPTKPHHPGQDAPNWSTDSDGDEVPSQNKKGTCGTAR